MARAGLAGCTLKEIREELVRRRYRELLHSARGRKLEVALTLDEYRQVTSSNACFYCGGDLPFIGSGLDRKDSSRGYCVDNVVPCCRLCNRIKSDILDATTMSGMIVQLAVRRLRRILEAASLPIPALDVIRSWVNAERTIERWKVEHPVTRRGRRRWQRPRPRLIGSRWEISYREDEITEKGTVRRKKTQTLGYAHEMDFAQAQLEADQFIERVNASINIA